MRKWCRRLLDPQMCRWVKARDTSINVQSVGRASYRSPSYVFADAMEEAGLIEWAARLDYPGLQAQLTEAGRRAAGQP